MVIINAGLKRCGSESGTMNYGYGHCSNQPLHCPRELYIVKVAQHRMQKLSLGLSLSSALSSSNTLCYN